MKKFLLKLMVAFILIITLSISGYAVYGHFFANETHMMTYQDKLENLSKIEGNKAVFVGGSGTHFGVSAKMFEEQTGVSAINMGLHASISFNTYLNAVEPYLNKGDYLMIIPEYDYYCTPWIKTDSQNTEFAVYYNKNILRYAFESKDALPNLLYTGWSEWSNVLKQIISLVMNGRTTEAYSRFDTNQWGDFTGNEGNHPISKSVSTFSNVDIESLNALCEKVKYLENKGIIVYVLFPPYLEEAYNKNEKIINETYEFLNDHSFKMLYTPQESKYEEKLFYDTVYHLNSKGTRLYTQMIIDCYMKSNVS